MWVGVAPPEVGPMCIVGDVGCGWALHSDGDKRSDGRENEFTQVGLVEVWVVLCSGAVDCVLDACHEQKHFLFVRLFCSPLY